MDFQGIYDRLKAQGAPGLLEANEPRLPDPENKKDKGRAGDAYVVVDRAEICAFMDLCKKDERLNFEIVMDLTACDPSTDSEDLWMLYQLFSVKNRQRLMVKVMVPKSDPTIDTISGINRAAQWHERECAEMFGIEFNHHPDPRNILLPDDWVGYPLRKDYEFPTEYHGISCI